MFVTLNPPSPPAAEKVLRRLQLAHPVFGPDMVAAQAALPGVQVRIGIANFESFLAIGCDPCVVHPRPHTDNTLPRYCIACSLSG